VTDSLTPSQRTLRARMGAFAMHARHDPRKTTNAGRRAFLARFEIEVDPRRELSAKERARRSEAARKLYFTRLAFESSLRRAPRKRPSSPANGSSSQSMAASTGSLPARTRGHAA
jgi:hypothetical protein